MIFITIRKWIPIPSLPKKYRDFIYECWKRFSTIFTDFTNITFRSEKVVIVDLENGKKLQKITPTMILAIPNVVILLSFIVCCLLSIILLP